MAKELLETSLTSPEKVTQKDECKAGVQKWVMDASSSPYVCCLMVTLLLGVAQAVHGAGLLSQFSLMSQMKEKTIPVSEF